MNLETKLGTFAPAGLTQYVPRKKEKNYGHTSILYVVIKNKANFRQELSKKLDTTINHQWASKLTKKLAKPISVLSSEYESQTGIIKLKVKKTSFMIYHYLMKFKGKAQKFIEIFLFDLSRDMNLSATMRELFKDAQVAYRSYLKTSVNSKCMKYLKLIGKGESDYDIEKKLRLSRVELIELKQKLASSLNLRNNNELYWVSQRAGYVRWP